MPEVCGGDAVFCQITLDTSFDEKNAHILNR